MIGWITFLTILTIGVVAVWAGQRFLAGFRLERAAERHQAYADALARLGASLNIGQAEVYTTLGARSYILEGEFNRLGVVVEVFADARDTYLRVTLRFRRPLAQDLRVLSVRNLSLRNWFMRLQEVEVGDPEFDRHFVLLTRDEQRLHQILSPSVRYQFQRIAEVVDDLRLNDDNLFLFADGVSDPATISYVTRKALELGERLYTTAADLGPAASRVEAAAYQQGTAGYAAREEARTTGAMPAVTGQHPAVTGQSRAIDPSDPGTNQ